MNKEIVKGYLRLMRPANLPTAMADVLAGFTIAGLLNKYTSAELLSIEMIMSIAGLLLSTVCLYAGGVVLNDVFDFELDKRERPERPLPSGAVTIDNATIFGSALLLAGLITAFMVNPLSGYIALAIVVSIVIYNALAKHNVVFGPLVMGMCRGFNLLLGMAIVGYIHIWWITVIPVLYIGAITLISQGEVSGGNRRNIVIASVLYGLVVLAVAQMSFYETWNIFQTLPFLILFSVLIYRPLLKAHKDNSASNVQNAVKSGVLSLIVLDACIAVGFSKWWYGLLILMLLPLSRYLSRRFAVT